MKKCVLEVRFDNKKHPGQIRCGCDGSIRNPEKCGSFCPKFKSTLRYRLARTLKGE